MTTAPAEPSRAGSGTVRASVVSTMTTMARDLMPVHLRGARPAVRPLCDHPVPPRARALLGLRQMGAPRM
ncbi:hypothetical protein GCM10010319_14930 [Streptomyces blastmyceticus]|uniref:Uncharacterized protein n=1 Tax=Streptomyces blastmyceticus TaxID=68180 RepID=A0ABN0WKB4_9ACTN